MAQHARAHDDDNHFPNCKGLEGTPRIDGLLWQQGQNDQGRCEQNERIFQFRFGE